MLHEPQKADNEAALQEIAAKPPKEPAARGMVINADRRELREHLQKEGEKAARGMARVVEMAAEELGADDWETPEEELDRHLGVLPFDEWIRQPRKYIEPAEGIVSTPELCYTFYAQARHVVITKKGVARRLGITEQTLHGWIKDKKLLELAIRAGESVQEERLASRMASGIKYPQSIFAVLKNLHHWADKIDETHHLPFLEALQKAQQQAKRVQWDKALPAQLPHGAPIPVQVIDAQPVDASPVTQPAPPAGA